MLFISLLEAVYLIISLHILKYWSLFLLWNVNFELLGFWHAERLALIRQQRLEAAKKREEEKAGMFVAPVLTLRYLLSSELCPV